MASIGDSVLKQRSGRTLGESDIVFQPPANVGETALAHQNAVEIAARRDHQERHEADKDERQQPAMSIPLHAS
jgi:hypothetical protein